MRYRRHSRRSRCRKRPRTPSTRPDAHQKAGLVGFTAGRRVARQRPRVPVIARATGDDQPVPPGRFGVGVWRSGSSASALGLHRGQQATGAGQSHCHANAEVKQPVGGSTFAGAATCLPGSSKSCTCLALTRPFSAAIGMADRQTENSAATAAMGRVSSTATNSVFWPITPKASAAILPSRFRCSAPRNRVPGQCAARIPHRIRSDAKGKLHMPRRGDVARHEEVSLR